MKPKRPTETDLLALVQNGFNAQLPKDRAAQTQPREGTAGQPATLQPMARTTLTIPEELRYRLKLDLMNRRRHGGARMTQDEFCAEAIGKMLDLDQDRVNPWNRCSLLEQFLRSCLEGGGMNKTWAPRAQSLVDDIEAPACPQNKPPAPTKGPRQSVSKPVPQGDTKP